jgi:hypothetical protein
MFPIHTKLMHIKVPYVQCIAQNGHLISSRQASDITQIREFHLKNFAQTFSPEWRHNAISLICVIRAICGRPFFLNPALSGQLNKD